MKKILVIVPHEDDEINLVGSVMDQLWNDDNHIEVLFVTNGDYYIQNTRKRIDEAFKAAKSMRIEKLHFLGYPDNGIHLRYSRDSIVSHACYKNTYGVGKAVDYRWLKSNCHSEYNYENLLKDMFDCLYDIRADLIFCVDADDHPDHKLVSMVFEDAMKYLITDKQYCPIILKKFAYEGVWFGPKDYFCRPMKETKSAENTIRPFFPYDKSQIIKFEVFPENYDLRFWRTNVFKWLRIYNSQNAIMTFECVVNSDDVYFLKNTRNLALIADIEVSSGNSRLLNDFKYISYKDVREQNLIAEEILKESVWMPSNNDEEKKIIFKFNNEINVKEIDLFQSLDISSSIRKISVRFNNCDYKLYELTSDFKNVIYVNEIGITCIEIKIIESVGNKIGFSQIEIYDSLNEPDWNDIPLNKKNEKEKYRYNNKFLCLLYKKIF